MRQTRPLALIAALASPLVFSAAVEARQDPPKAPGGADAIEADDKPQDGRNRMRPQGGPGRSGQGGARGQDPLRGSVTAGTQVPDFANLTVLRSDGSEAKLSSMVPEDGHLVVVTGCLTCPKFLISHREVEAIAHDHRTEGTPVAFVYLYKSLAHPENGGWIQPFTSDERLAQVKAAESTLKTKVPFVCDLMDNGVSNALGGSPNAAYIVHGSDGTIDYVSGWAEGPALRAALVEVVGPTEATSTPESIGVPPFARPSRNTGAVVPRVEVPGTMSALKTKPGSSDEPHYVKLRIEAEPTILSGKPGKLYVGFHLDPVHGVHWNNLVDPVAFTITLPEDVKISPVEGKGSKVEPATDSDPREFLLDVAEWPSDATIEIEVRYYACSEKEGWCKPVTQTYQVALERDRAAGMAQNRWNRGGGGPDRGAGQRGGGTDPIAMMDRNGDDRIERSEAPERMRQRFDSFDVDQDGYISGDELETLRERMAQRQRGGRGNRRGSRDRPGPGGAS